MFYTDKFFFTYITYLIKYSIGLLLWPHVDYTYRAYMFAEMQKNIRIKIKCQKRKKVSKRLYKIVPVLRLTHIPNS